jgi:ubiquinone/menaquinone biosynthesis C-methylase UbiE
MGTVEENKRIWDQTYNWHKAGDEWSIAWGGVCAQWYGVLLPRVYRFLPAQTILEISPGYGRWSQFLVELCSSLILVDISESCIKACKERFSNESHISYHINDGSSLEMIADNSVDFVFSFDSLVHVDDDIIEAYVCQISRKLTSNGVAFLHHSNLGDYKYQVALSRIPKIRAFLRLLGLIEKKFHWRSSTMSAKKMQQFSEKKDLRCISQEFINWGTKSALIDCLSTIVKKDSKWSRKNRLLKNRTFMKQAGYISELSKLYNY